MEDDRVGAVVMRCDVSLMHGWMLDEADIRLCKHYMDAFFSGARTIQKYKKTFLEIGNADTWM